MSGPVVTDPFFRALYTKLVEDLDNRVTSLARGGALILGANTGLDAVTTAMKYQAAVSYIEALQAVIDVGLEIDRERYGVKTKNNDGED